MQAETGAGTPSAMIDRALRLHKERLLVPVARRVPGWLHPTGVTAAAAVPGIAAAAAAAAAAPTAAVTLWLLNRLLDGLDGTLARQTDRQSEFGALADILLDVVVYAAVPLGMAAGQDSRAAWMAAAVLLASFYVNAVSWTYLSALLERRGAGARERGELTAVTMPPGLVEGAETVVIFAIALALPAWSVGLMWAMAAAVIVGVGQRVVWAARELGTS